MWLGVRDDFRNWSGLGVQPAKGDGGNQDLNSVNQVALERLQHGRQAFVSSTSLNGVFWLRACVSNPRTTIEDLHALLDAVRIAATGPSRERAARR
jgi:hypothetical protein